MQMSSEQQKDRMPWAFAVGVALAVLGVVATTQAAPAGPVVVIVGVVLVAAGLVQRSLARR